MRAGFVTCVQLGLGCMEEIYSAGGRLEVVLTLHDDLATGKSGRVWVDDFAAHHDIPVVKAANVNEPEAVAALAGYALDWLFIIGWSQIARREVLSLPRRGVLGMHPTLLPVGRGRAAIPWAILKGLSVTGVTLFQLDEGVDTGPIVSQIEVPVDPRETATTLYSKVEAAHRELIRRTWPDLAAGRVRPRPQDERRATEWPGRRPADGVLLPFMTVAEADRLVRAVTHPYPGAFMDTADGRRLRIWSADPEPPGGDAVAVPCADGTLYATSYAWDDEDGVGNRRGAS